MHLKYLSRIYNIGFILFLKNKNGYDRLIYESKNKNKRDYSIHIDLKNSTIEKCELDKMCFYIPDITYNSKRTRQHFGSNIVELCEGCIFRLGSIDEKIQIRIEYISFVNDTFVGLVGLKEK